MENRNLRLKAGGHFSVLLVNARYPERGTSPGESYPVEIQYDKHFHCLNIGILSIIFQLPVLI